jgi:hypothetical protein
MVMDVYSQYYVYHHKNPQTNEIIYIGSGTAERAWAYNWAYSRQRDHVDHLHELAAQGYLPCDWVVVVRRGMTRDEARSLEKEEIIQHKPKFNRHKGYGSFRDPEQAKKAKTLREEGMSFAKIADQLGVTAMTAWRACNGG